MSQVDYVHFFNNIVWTYMHMIIVYVVFSGIYVQIFYKVLRLRNWGYKGLGRSLNNTNLLSTENKSIIMEGVEKCVFYSKKMKYNIFDNLFRFKKFLC